MKRLKKISEIMLASPIYTLSVVFLTLLIVLSLIAPLIPIDPSITDVSNISQPPSWSYLFGTDKMGWDYLIRVIYGGRVSLFMDILVMIATTFIGTLAGLVSGYFSGWIDNLLMRLVDVLSSIPWLVLVTVLSVFLRPGLTTIIIVTGEFLWMNTTRLIRGETLAAKEREYVAYGKFIGRSSFDIIVKHVSPAVLPTLIVAASTSISGAIMTESALGFLGLGIQQPMASRGSLLQNAQNSLQRAPYMAILSGLFVIFTIYSFNNIGDMIKHVLQREV